MTSKRIAATELDLDGSFLTHSTNASGSGFLKNWKETGEIVVWLHPEAKLWSVWNHTWYRYGKEHDSETDKDFNVIIPQRLLCLENEKLLKRQHFRNDDDSREMEPEICPLDLCIEWLRGEINAGRLEWSTPVFKFESESPIPEDNNDVILYAGGFTGLFLKKDKTRRELAELNKAGIKEKEAYLQNGAARLQYLMAVASAEDLDAGWLLAMEAPTLGNKLKKEIKAEINRCDGNVQEGSPKYNPYPFQWTYDENKDFSDRYEVVAKSRTKPSKEVLQLLKEDPPNVDHLTQPPKLGSLLASMKQHALIEMPFDKFFKLAAKEFGMETDDEEPAEKPARTHDVRSKKVDTEEDEEQSDEESDTEAGDDEPSTCEVCKEVIGDEEMTCSHCGAIYNTDDEGNVFLSSRPCGNPDCDEKRVAIETDGTGTCPKCKTVHELDSEGDWKIETPEPPKPAKDSKPQTSARRRGSPAKHTDARESRRSQARKVAGK